MLLCHHLEWRFSSFRLARYTAKWIISEEWPVIRPNGACLHYECLEAHGPRLVRSVMLTRSWRPPRGSSRRVNR